MTKPDEDFKRNPPPHLRMPDGTSEERRAWWKVVIAEADANGDPVELSPEDVAQGVKRRGRERLARLRDAA